MPYIWTKTKEHVRLNHYKRSESNEQRSHLVRFVCLSTIQLKMPLHSYVKTLQHVNKILPSLGSGRYEKRVLYHGTSQTYIFSSHWSLSCTLRQSVRLPLGDMLTMHTSHTHSHALTHSCLAIGTSKTIRVQALGSNLDPPFWYHSQQQYMLQSIPARSLLKITYNSLIIFYQKRGENKIWLNVWLNFSCLCCFSHFIPLDCYDFQILLW